MSTVLTQAIATRPRTAKTVITILEAERVWAALSRVLRAQLLLGNSVAIFRHTCAFWYKQQHVVTDGATKYFRRVPQFGFNPTFATTYSLDAIVEREDQKTAFHRLPLEYVASEARLPAEHVAMIINEVFLYIGEALFSGKMLSLSFTGVATVLVKRERANVTFDESFLSDLFAIDSRKWPLAVREVALKAAPIASAAAAGGAGSRPSSASAAARPRSASSAAAASATAPNAAQPPRPLPPRPSFVSAAPAGKLFAELENRPVRRAPSANAAAKRPASGGPLRALRPAHLQQQQQDHHAGEAPHTGPVAFVGADGEEESVYAMLSPQRHADVAAAPDAFDALHAGAANGDEAGEWAQDAVGEWGGQQQEYEAWGSRPVTGASRVSTAASALHQQQQEQQEPQQTRVVAPHRHTDVFFLDEIAPNEMRPAPFGRKRVTPLTGARNDIRSILYQLPTSVEADVDVAVSGRGRQRAHAAEVDHVGSLLRRRQ